MTAGEVPEPEQEWSRPHFKGEGCAVASVIALMCAGALFFILLILFIWSMGGMQR